MPNELTQYSFDPKDIPGATRIGHVWLHVPPLNVHFNNPKFEDQMLTIRQQGPNYIKTGRGLWSFDMDIVFSGRDMINGKLAKILAMIRRTPLITIWNETVRKISDYRQTGIIDLIDNEIPVAINGYTLNTEPDLPDTITMRLSFLVYNAKPLVNSFQYLRQEIDKDGKYNFNVPAMTIENSNLWTQYVESLVKDSVAIEGFMFDGECDITGTTTNEARASFDLSNDNTFISRASLDSPVLRNGQAIKAIGSEWGSAEGNESFVIGYHVNTIAEVFDLRLGAYKSRRSGEWIWTEEAMKDDVCKHLKIEMKVEDVLEDIIKNNMEDLLDLPVINQANKYIKKFAITGNGTTSINGVTIRRSIPISVLPIVSSPIPTCQYLGGGMTDITLSLVTTDESFVETITAVDKSIEAAARNKMRHGGSELTYIDNDMVNLNGTYTVHTGLVDIQNVPENPGTYIITWMMNEQTEVLSVLDSKIEEKRNYKKRLLKRLIQYYAPEWNYRKSQKSDKDVKFTFNEVRPSYVETILIPSMIRLVRNAFIRWLKEGEKWEIEKMAGRNVFTIPTALELTAVRELWDQLANNPEMNIDALFGEYLDPDKKDTAPKVVNPSLPGQGSYNASNVPADYGQYVGAVVFSREKAYNQMWNHMVGNDTSTPTVLWNKFLQFMMIQAQKDPDFNIEDIVRASATTDKEVAKKRTRAATLLAGTIQTILNGDCRRFEMMIRSPHLLKYELGLVGGLTAATTSATTGGQFSNCTNRWGTSFVLRTDILNLYNLFKADLKAQGIDIDIISGWRGPETNAELQESGTTDVGFEDSAHSFGVAVDFQVLDSKGNSIPRNDVPTTTWDAIGVVARKYFKWGGDYLDPELAARERNHISIKRWSKEMAATFRQTYKGYYTKSENLLKYGVSDYAVIEAPDPYISCYTDLGLPFAYHPEDNDGNLLRDKNGNLVASILMNDPTFYLRHYTPLDDETNVKSRSEIDKNIHTDAVSLGKVSGAGANCASIERPYMRTSNEINLAGYEAQDATNSAKSNKDISKTEADKQMEQLQKKTDDQIKSLNGQGMYSSTYPTTFGTFKSVNELFLSNSLVKSLGSFGSETSPMVIAEAEYEHNLFRSTFKDYNASIDHTIPNIVEEARQEIIGNKNYYSMTRALPTYKLYFREENSPEWFLFDNFFDYRAVEAIRLRMEKASPSTTLRITLNNFNATLTDLTALMSKESFAADRRNMDNRIENQYTGKSLKRLFVQPGTQIQLRMGYDGNPNEMPIMFNGFVCEVSPGEKYEIVAQSYGAELFNEADTGSFLGWICPPKSFIWWMLLDSKVKHLGRLVQASVLPTTASDFIDGPAFDDNIYIDLEMEPGKWRLLQSYNADNMTKWDALQDIAAAHPGFICHVVPYDDRETVFFGRPDDWYKFTQDLGTTREYLNLDDTLGMDRVPMLGGGWNSLTQKVKDGKDVRQLLKEAVAKNSKGKPINYLQWLKIKDKIEEAFANWRAQHSEDGKKGLIWSLMQYCHLVETLTTLSGDGATGNIQYWLGSGNPSDNKNLTSDKRDFGLDSKEESPSAVKDGQIGEKPEVARMAEDIIKNQPGSPVSKNILDHLNPVVKSSVLKALSGRTIPLANIYDDSDIKAIVNMVGLGNGMEAGDFALEDSQVNYLTNIQNILDKYDISKDEERIKTELKNTTSWKDDRSNLEDILDKMKIINERYGIESPIAVLLWWKIADVWNRIITGLPGTEHAQDLSGIGIRMAGSAYEAENKKAISFSGHIPFDLAVVHRTGDSNVSVTPNNVVRFEGPVFRTDLKTHILLRNVILTYMVDIIPEFQTILAELGHSPIQRRFRRYHLATGYEHIVNNNIRSNFAGMWNRVRVKYKRHDFMDYYVPFLPQIIFGDKPNNEFEIQAGDTLDDKVTRELVMPVENAKTVGQARNYATSILAEGIRNMYTGELSLLGNPTIKPYDIVYIHDDYSHMYGPVEVNSVTHVISHDTGFISIIEPHAHVDVLSQGMGPASIIKEVFDLAMLALIVFPPLSGLGTAARTSQVVGKNAVKKGIANAFAKGRSFGEAATSYLKTKYNVAADVLAANTKTALKSNSLDFMTKKSVNEPLTAIVNQVNKNRLAKNELAKTIDLFDEATPGEVAQAMKDILKAQPGTTLSGEIDTVMAKSYSQAAVAGVGSAAKTAGTAVKSSLVPKNFLASITGISWVNMVKTLAVAGQIAYYQMFAGMDDDAYACPLRITPLSLNGHPFQAGLDGITHRSGIWQHIAGEWRRFFGSVNTVSSALDEFYTSVTGEWS